MKSQTAPSTPAQSNGIRVVTSTRSINQSLNQSFSQSMSPPPDRERTISGDHSGMGSIDQSTNQSNNRFWSAVSNTVKFLSNLALDDDLSPSESIDQSIDQSTNQSLNRSSSQSYKQTGRTTRSKSHSGSSTEYPSSLQSPTNQSTNHSTNHSTNQSTNQPAHIRVDDLKSPNNRSQSSVDIAAIEEAISQSSNHSTNQSTNHSSNQSSTTQFVPPSLSRQISHQSLNPSSFDRLLESDTIDLSKLRKVCWRGVPRKYRGQVWKILLGYLPLRRSKRANLLLKRRLEYVQMIKNDYLPVEQAMKQLSEAGMNNPSINQSIHLDDTSRTIIGQIKQDVPRTSPANPFFKQPIIQESLTRILFLFALRHPASGYVQGINDLLTPFYATFFDELAIEKPEIITQLATEQLDEEGQVVTDTISSSSQPNSPSVSQSTNQSVNQTDSITPCPLPLQCTLSESDLLGLESDCFWCLSSFIDRIQDHYIFAQPGIQRGVWLLQHLTETIQPDLAKHFDEQGVTFMHFAFRWMNCLLMREMSLKCTIRLFDTYLSVDPGSLADPSINSSINPSLEQSIDARGGFGQFHIYVCLAFLLYFAPKLKEMEFQDLILFLQKLPTSHWSMAEMDSLIAQAFVYQNTE